MLDHGKAIFGQGLVSRCRFLLVLCLLAVPDSLPAAAPETAPSYPFPPRAEPGPQHRRQEALLKAGMLKGLVAGSGTQLRQQESYDVRFYDLDLVLDPVNRILTGQVTVRATVAGDELATMDLNLDNGMVVSSVTAGGSLTSFLHVDDVLTVQLDHVYDHGAEVEVSVSYGGDPAGDSFAWSHHGGEDMIWTLSQPYGAREWWPCKDRNDDKADSVSVRATVPDDLYAVSNGLLVSLTDNGDTRTFHWLNRYPIATYLVSLAVHPYSIYNDWYFPVSGGDPMEVAFFVFPDHLDDVQETYALTVPMLEEFSLAFGEYPFLTEKYGHAEITFSGGMEHQTVASLGGCRRI